MSLIMSSNSYDKHFSISCCNYIVYVVGPYRPERRTKNINISGDRKAQTAVCKDHCDYASKS